MDETNNNVLVKILSSINNFQEVMIDNMNYMKEDIKDLKDDMKDMKEDMKNIKDDMKDVKGQIKDLKVEVQKNAEIENTHWEENKRLWAENNERWEENKRLWAQNEENRKKDISYLNDIIFNHEVYIASALGDPNAEKMKNLKKKVI